MNAISSCKKNYTSFIFLQPHQTLLIRQNNFSDIFGANSTFNRFLLVKKRGSIFFLIIIHSLSKQLYKAKFCSSWSFYSKSLFLFTIGSFASLASAHYPRVSVFMINIAPSYFSFILDKAIKHKYCNYTKKKILYLRCIYYYNEI